MTSPDQIAKECFEKYGVFPISFCLPTQKVRPFREKSKTKDVSFIVPGDSKTFVFGDEASYMNEYQVSRFARTRKKGGWDCVRHLEIMAASCLPLFQDIENCPEYTMVHYPKEMFKNIKDHHETMTDSEYDRWSQQLYDWFFHHLTSDKMVEYMLRVSGNAGARKILFIDRALVRKPDCESAMILGGLKNKFGSLCDVAYPVECMYRDRPFPEKPRWWKTNFNIYQSLEESQRSENEKKPDIGRIRSRIAAREYDLIVYGSVTRSLELFQIVTNYYPKEKVIGINGADDLLTCSTRPPFSKRLKQRLRNRLQRNRYSGPQLNPSLSAVPQWRELFTQVRSKCTIFMRELYV